MPIDEKRLLDLEIVTRNLSEGNKLLTYQITTSEIAMKEFSKTLHEVRDALLRLEAIEHTRNYPAQLSNIRNDLDNLETRVRSLEGRWVKQDAETSLIGWFIQNWQGLAALAVFAFLAITYILPHLL